MRVIFKRQLLDLLQARYLACYKSRLVKFIVKLNYLIESIFRVLLFWSSWGQMTWNYQNINKWEELLNQNVLFFINNFVGILIRPELFESLILSTFICLLVIWDQVSHVVWNYHTEDLTVITSRTLRIFLSFFTLLSKKAILAHKKWHHLTELVTSYWNTNKWSLRKKVINIFWFLFNNFILKNE